MMIGSVDASQRVAKAVNAVETVSIAAAAQLFEALPSKQPRLDHCAGEILRLPER
jgi:hypothetical protein